VVNKKILMNKIKAIIVDDETSARDVLENLLLRFCPEVEVFDKCKNVQEAVDSVNKNKPDVVFLDIEMPNYAGYEIVKFFDKIEFDIVFVTAYDKYALRAFEIAAVDYLLKPIDVDRLKLTVERLKSNLDKKQLSERVSLMNQTLQEKSLKNILISEKGNQEIVSVDSIIAIEAQESYCNVITESNKFIVSKNLKHFETVFEEHPDFIRVHKSWLINKKHIKNYSKSELEINLTNGISAKLSKYKKAEFEEAILA
jgi:two-component system LytT family response regulator